MRMQEMKDKRDALTVGQRVVSDLFDEPWYGTYEGPATDGTIRGLVRFDDSRRATALEMDSFEVVR